MSGLPYYKAYPRDFLEGTVGMSLELKGAYRLLLDLIYMHSGKLPDDARFISGHLGCSVRAWNGLRKTLSDMGKIVCENGIISNFRASFELHNLEIIQDKQRKNASKPRKNNGLTVAMAEPKPSHTEPDTDIPPKSPKGESPEKVLREVLSQDTVEAFLEHRKAKRIKVTQRAAELIAAKLRGHPSPDAVVLLSIENGWTGIFPEKIGRHPPTAGPDRAERLAKLRKISAA